MRRDATALVLCACACSGETRVDLLAPINTSKPDAAPDATGGATGAPDAASVSDPHLIHRYSFNGSEPRVIDSMGGPDGTLENGAVLDGSGHAVLDGQDDFVDLPDGLISSLSSATLYGWLSWNGGHAWQRVFDFGSNDGDAGDVGNATSSIFATVLRNPEVGPSAAFETSEGILGSVDGNTKFPVLQNTSIAVVLDPPKKEMRLYVAGKRIGAGNFGKLSAINDVNDWLGRSQWVQDLYLRGSLDEFRIYDVALDDDAIAAIDSAGADVSVPQ